MDEHEEKRRKIAKFQENIKETFNNKLNNLYISKEDQKRFETELQREFEEAIRDAFQRRTALRDLLLDMGKRSIALFKKEEKIRETIRLMGGISVNKPPKEYDI